MAPPLILHMLYSFQIFVQSLSRKFRSSNENVNENKNFRSFSRTFLLKFLTKIEKFVRNFHEIRLNFRPFVHNIIFSQKYKYKPNDLDKFIKYFKSNSIKFNIYFVNINLQTIVSLSQSFLS